MSRHAAEALIIIAILASAVTLIATDHGGWVALALAFLFFL